MVDREPITGVPKNPIEIVSPDGSITLRQFTPEDAIEAFDLIDRNREHLSQFGDPTSRNYPTYDSMLESIIQPKNPKRLRFAIRNQSSTYLGTINLTPQYNSPTTGEVGYYIGSEFQGQGYTTKALETLTDFAFENLGYDLLYGAVDEDNSGSIRVLQKAGYYENDSFSMNQTTLIHLYKTKPSTPTLT